MGFGWALTGAIPALVAMWYFDRLDAKRPEPRSTLRKVAIAGGLSVIPVIIVGLALRELTPSGVYEAAAYTAFVLAAGVEEAAKILCVYWLVWKLPEFDERMDGIVYAARAGLGFALVENILYLMGAPNMKDFVFIFIARALLVVPGHAIWAGIMGYFAARQRFDRTGIGLLGGYLIAVALHGLYDVAIFWFPHLHADFGSGAIAVLAIPIMVIVGGAIALRKLARRALALDDAAELRQQAGALPVPAGQPPPGATQ